MNNLSTLRVEGTDQAVDALLAVLKEATVLEQITRKWKKGDPLQSGEVREWSGFVATVFDAASPYELVLALRKFLADCEKHGLQFNESDLSAELSIGLMVGDSEQYIACLDFEPADLALLGKLGIWLSVNAYPVSDEANDEYERSLNRNYQPPSPAKKVRQLNTGVKAMSAKAKAFFQALYESDGTH